VKVVPLAADSLGVRSMATYVECGETRILIDPGASLGERRFNLPPADEEWEALRRANDRIAGYAVRAGLVVISHYHEDHFRYDAGLYAGRIVWAKDPARMVSGRQAARAATLQAALAGRCRLDAADGRRLETREAVVTASPPLPHGPDGTALGTVIAITVTDPGQGERFVHASDVQGPLSPVASAYLIRERPTLLYLSGPPAYLEAQLGRAAIERGVDNLLRVIDATGCRVIMDHHAVRDARYPERFDRLWATGKVQTAAGFLGQPESPLEARRLVLWAARRKASEPLPPRSPRRADTPPVADRRAERRPRRGRQG